MNHLNLISAPRSLPPESVCYKKVKMQNLGSFRYKATHELMTVTSKTDIYKCLCPFLWSYIFSSIPNFRRGLLAPIHREGSILYSWSDRSAVNKKIP
jgi:hypothetical protein